MNKSRLSIRKAQRHEVLDSYFFYIKDTKIIFLSALTAAVSYYAEVKKLFDVPAGCFMPKPKVDSAVVKLSLYETPPVDCNEATLFKVIRGAFAQRRKTLVNSLSTVIGHIPKATLAELIVSCGYPETVRGETIDIQGFAKLANAIDRYQT